MNLPAPIRAFQQTYWYHALKSALYAGLTAAVTAYFSPNKEAAAAVGVTTFLGAFQSGIEHGPGSATFKADGEVNPTVEAAANIQKAVEKAPESFVAVKAFEDLAAQAQQAAVVATAVKFEEKPVK